MTLFTGSLLCLCLLRLSGKVVVFRGTDIRKINCRDEHHWKGKSWELPGTGLFRWEMSQLELSSGLVPALVFAAPGSVFRKHHSCPSSTRTHTALAWQGNDREQEVTINLGRERGYVEWTCPVLSCPLPSWEERDEAEWDMAQLLTRAFRFPGSPKSCVSTGPLPRAIP